MLLRVNVSLIAVFFLILLMPLSIAQAYTHVEVAVDQLNIRSEPNTTTQIVATLKKATRLPITKQQKEWTQVKLPNGNTGWVNNKYVKMIEVPQIKYVKSNVDMLNVRAEPNATAQILQIIDKNGVYLQSRKQGEWAQIKLSDQKSGWVKASYLTETSAPAPVPPPVPVTPPVTQPVAPPVQPPLPPPPPPVAPPTTGPEFDQGTIVLTEGYEVYAQPDILGTVIGQIHGGMTINHYGYANGWYTINFNGSFAYIFKPIEQVESGMPQPPPTAAQPPTTVPPAAQELKIRVKNPDSNLRNGPGTEYNIVGTVQPGQVFPVVQTVGDWYIIRLADNSTAYIAGWIVDKIPPAGSLPPTGAQYEYNNGMVGNEKVYIYHTHNRESWRNVARNQKGSSVDDPEVNITLVGKRLSELLQGRGITAMASQDDFAQRLREQNKTYSMSYSESYKAVAAAAATSPNLQYIFDIHRDSDEPRSKVAITINGKTYARMMFVIGTANPNHPANKKLAENLHARLEANYPGLSRGVLLKGSNQGNGVYNQSISEGALLLEFGGTNNTLEECYNTAEAFAEVFGNYVIESQIAFNE